MRLTRGERRRCASTNTAITHLSVTSLAARRLYFCTRLRRILRCQPVSTFDHAFGRAHTHSMREPPRQFERSLTHPGRDPSPRPRPPTHPRGRPPTGSSLLVARPARPTVATPAIHPNAVRSPRPARPDPASGVFRTLLRFLGIFSSGKNAEGRRSLLYRDPALRAISTGPIRASASPPPSRQRGVTTFLVTTTRAGCSRHDSLSSSAVSRQ